MKKVKMGVIGHFGGTQLFLDGQTVKTKIFYEEIYEQLGKSNISYIDTFNWKSKPFKLLFKSILMATRSRNIVIILSHRGRDIFIPFLAVLGKIFKCRIHTMIIGGKFADDMQKNHITNFFAKRINSICVETKKMENKLKKLGYKNVFTLPNFKKLDKAVIDKKQEIEYPIRVCTFSRVCKEKGIEDIIDAIEFINNKYNNEIYTLDIYGQIDEGYKRKFEEIVAISGECIKYKGMVDYRKSVETIKTYVMLAFPTYFEGEGFPGTIIDSYFAGVPVIASDWRHNREIIIDNVTGILYETHNKNMLVEKLEFIMDNDRKILEMKEKCLEVADNYSAERIVRKYLHRLGIT